MCNLINIHTYIHGEDGGWERESGNLGSGNIGGSEDATEGARPMSNQQPRPQDPTPPRDHRIVRRTRAQGRKARDGIGEGGGETNKRNPRRVIQ